MREGSQVTLNKPAYAVHVRHTDIYVGFTITMQIQILLLQAFLPSCLLVNTWHGGASTHPSLGST